MKDVFVRFIVGELRSGRRNPFDRGKKNHFVVDISEEKNINICIEKNDIKSLEFRIENIKNSGT